MQKHNFKFKILFLFSILYFLSSNAVLADYVLPYPSYMPSHKLYKLHQIWEKLMEYYSFGSISQYKFHLNVSDKYLVEAKTLFEYKQHKLALTALEKSDVHFNKAGLSLISALGEGKNIDNQKEQFIKAEEKHILVVDELLQSQPERITWHEEKQEQETLEIKYFLTVARKQRELITNYLDKND